jgi:sarcosine oxidase subunit beta
MGDLPPDYDMSAMEVQRNDRYVTDVIHAAQQRFPWINADRQMTVTTGIMTFTPDGKPFCGAMPNIDGLYHCAGFSGHGIVQSPAIGVIMTELIMDGRSSYDIDAIEADRYFDVAAYQDRREIQKKCHEMYASYYGRVERP